MVEGAKVRLNLGFPKFRHKLGFFKNIVAYYLSMYICAFVSKIDLYIVFQISITSNNYLNARTLNIIFDIEKRTTYIITINSLA